MKLIDHNKLDPVGIRQTGNAVTLFNRAAEKYLDRTDSRAVITVSDESVNTPGPVLFSDKDAEGQSIDYTGETARNLAAGAIAVKALPIDQQTFLGLQQISTNYRFINQSALDAMHYLAEFTAQFRSELRTRQAA